MLKLVFICCAVLILWAGTCAAQPEIQVDQLDEDALSGALELLPRFGFDDLDALSELLRSDSPAVRQSAALSLGMAEALTPELRDLLIAALDDPQQDVRICAAWALATHGWQSGSAIRELLDDEEPAKRELATRGLLLAGETWGVPERNMLELVLGEQDPRWITAAAPQLASDPAVDSLVAKLGEMLAELNVEQNADTVEQLLQTVGWAGHNGTPYLLDALNHPYDVFRGAAAEALGVQAWQYRSGVFSMLYDSSYVTDALVDFPGPEGADSRLYINVLTDTVIPALLERLMVESSEDVIESLQRALHYCGPEAARQLAEELRSPADYRRVAALKALGEMGDATYVALPAIIELVHSEDRFVTVYATPPVARLALTDAKLRAELVDLLASGSQYEQSFALAIIKPLATLMPDAKPLLISLLTADSPQLAEQAAGVLIKYKLTDAEILQVAETMAQAGDAQLRQLVNFLHGEGSASLQVLISLLETADSAELRYMIAGILPDIGAGDSEAARALVKALEDDSSLVRQRAAQGLGQLTAAPELAVPALIRAAHGDDGALVLKSIQALSYYGEDAAGAVPMLLDMAAGDNMFIQDAAIIALGMIGPPAAEALDELEALAADPATAELAQQAIDSIKGLADPDTMPESENPPD